MTVSFWPYESQLYPMINSAGERGEHRVRGKFELGNGHKVEVQVFTFDKSPLNLHQIIGSTNIGFRANFWSGDHPWFRIDNDHGFLHLQKGDFKIHERLPDQISISGCLSIAFEKAKDVFKQDYSNNNVKEGSGFVGFK